MKILAVIPARGGSKTIPRKNVIPFAGKPLIYYTIRSALESKRIDRVIVSTDDEEIAKISKKYGAEVIKRPKTLATDSAPMVPVIQHAVKKLEKEGYNPDVITILQPTSPLRDSGDIDRALKMFTKSKSESMAGVCEAEKSPYWMYKIGKNGSLEALIKTRKKYTRRQDLPKVYRLNGAFYAVKREILMNKNTIYTRTTKPFFMSQLKSIDIDTKMDLKIAEIFLKNFDEYGKNKNR